MVWGTYITCRCPCSLIVGEWRTVGCFLVGGEWRSCLERRQTQDVAGISIYSVQGHSSRAMEVWILGSWGGKASAIASSRLCAMPLLPLPSLQRCHWTQGPGHRLGFPREHQGVVASISQRWRQNAGILEARCMDAWSPSV